MECLLARMTERLFMPSESLETQNCFPSQSGSENPFARAGPHEFRTLSNSIVKEPGSPRKPKFLASIEK